MQFDILGRTLLAPDIPEPLAAVLRQNWLFPEHQPRPTGYQITLRRGQRERADLCAESWQAHPLRRVQSVPRSFEVRAAPEGFFFEDASGALSCCHHSGHDSGAGYTELNVWLAPAGNISAEFEAALYLALQEALQCSGLLGFHAAAAVIGSASSGSGREEGEPVACAFLGASGQGKSTTLLRAIAAGWAPLSEDTFWYDPATGQLYGWERAVRLLPSSHAALPDEVREQVLAAGYPVTSDGKLNVPYSALPGGGGQRGGVPLGALALLSRQPGQPSGWQPLLPQAAALALWEAIGLPLSARGRRFVAAQIGLLLARVPACTLVLGDTPVPFADFPAPGVPPRPVGPMGQVENS